MEIPTDIFGQELRKLERAVRAMQAPVHYAMELQAAFSNCPALVEKDNLMRACEQYRLERDIAAMKDQWAELVKSRFLPPNHVLCRGRFERNA